MFRHLPYRPRLGHTLWVSALGCSIVLTAHTAHAQVRVGYYDMSAGSGSFSQVDSINRAGLTAVYLSDLTATHLAGINVLYVQNPSNGGFGFEYLSRLPAIQAAVQAGMVLVIHDRTVANAQTILPGGGSIAFVRDFTRGADIDILDSAIASGPGGTLTNASLDGGNYSNHGYAVSASLPINASRLLSNGLSSQIVTFSYPYGSGAVIYSSIPLDHYLAGAGPNPPRDNLRFVYAPNILAYAAGLAAVSTTTALTSSSNPAPAAQPVTFVATVTASTGNNPPTGSVNLLDATTIIGSATLVVINSTQSSVEFSISGLTPGTHPMKATYAGNANTSPRFAASESAVLNQVVNKISSTTTLNSSPNPSVLGQTVTFTAQVQPTSGSSTPTGSVTFTDGATTLATVGLVSGIATFATDSLAVGVHEIVASYAGDSLLNDSTGSVSQEVSKATPAVTWANPADIVYGTSLSGTQLNATASVPGTFTYTPAAGTVLNAGNAQTLTVSFTPDDSANYNTAARSVLINVLKATPLVTWTAPAPIVYPTALSGTQLNATTSVAGTFVYAPGVGTVLGPGAGQTLSASFAPNDSANYNSVVASTTITVNAAPVVALVSGPTVPLAQNVAAAINVTFDDAATNDTHTCQFAWDDGTPNTSVSVASSLSSCSGSHTYTAAGVYVVGVTVSDDDALFGVSWYRYVVVYDPNAGFVTGGGWIESPAGAYAADSSLAGRATFGFVSKYKKGMTVPTGETEFDFHVGGLRFKSTTYEWLVVSGFRAQYKGSGTINGTGDYGFLLTAVDGQVSSGGGVDKFRIKIWDRASSAVVYDNLLGAADDINVDPQALGGGSIVIHAK